MRNLLIFGMLLIAASAAGWFRVSRQGDRTTIEINRSEIRDDTRAVIDRGREFLDQREQAFAQDEPLQAPWPEEQVAIEPQPWQYDNQWPYQYQYPQQQYPQQQYPQQQYPQQTYPQQQSPPQY